MKLEQLMESVGSDTVTFGPQIMDDGNFERLADFLDSKGYQEDVDYAWVITMGDEYPNAMQIMNPVMKADRSLAQALQSVKGTSEYRLR